MQSRELPTTREKLVAWYESLAATEKLSALLLVLTKVGIELRITYEQDITRALRIATFYKRQRDGAGMAQAHWRADLELAYDPDGLLLDTLFDTLLEWERVEYEISRKLESNLASTPERQAFR